MKFSLIIATYNRADRLRDTLVNLGALRTTESWEAIIVDNNSDDDTRAVVEKSAEWFPVDLRYLFEPEQGKSAALNTSIRAARGDVLAFTDDDVRVESDWLDRAAEALDRHRCYFVGGKVLPIWEGPRPAWLPNRSGRHRAILALLDYGPEPIELVNRSPLGVNMAVRREAFTHFGLWWDNRVGRQGNTLRGQEQREWCARARAEGLSGFYAPDMIVHHIVPQDRLNKRYFRRWMYWNGISRSILYEMRGTNIEGREEAGPAHSEDWQIAGVPAYLFGRLLGRCADVLKAGARRDVVGAFEHEMRAWFYAGAIRQQWKQRKKSRPVEMQTSSATSARHQQKTTH
jgi:glycosyltransferase involved in cell wall biosynthesis